jgi:hypothetical protein
MNHKTIIAAIRFLLLGAFITGCSASARTATLPNAALDPSVRDQVVTLNAPADDWRIEVWCWYGDDHFTVQIYPPRVTDSVDVGCTYTTESGSGPCTYERTMNRFYTEGIANGTSDLTVTITGTGDPAPLTHSFSIVDAYPTTCEDDPAGWVMGPRCQPDGLLTVSFAYPDTYTATACNIIDRAGTSYACVIEPDARFSSLCVCSGLPVLGQYLLREIILGDGTQVYGPWKFTGIDEHYCNWDEPTQGVPGKESNPPGCSDYSDDKSCTGNGCFWWSSGGCYSNPEPSPFDCHQYDGDQAKCKDAYGSGCTWDDTNQTCSP